QGLHLVIGERNRLRIERVGLDNVRAGLKILPMNLFDDSRLRDIQQIVMTFEIFRPILELLSPKGRLIQLSLLNHCSHGTVKDEDALTQQRRNGTLMPYRHDHPMESPEYIDRLYIINLPLAIILEGL